MRWKLSEATSSAKTLAPVNLESQVSELHEHANSLLRLGDAAFSSLPPGPGNSSIRLIPNLVGSPSVEVNHNAIHDTERMSDVDVQTDVNRGSFSDAGFVNDRYLGTKYTGDVTIAATVESPGTLSTSRDPTSDPLLPMPVIYSEGSSVYSSFTVSRIYDRNRLR